MPAATLDEISPSIGTRDTVFPMTVRASPIDRDSIVVITVGGNEVEPARIDSKLSSDRMEVQITGAVTYLVGDHPVVVKNSDGTISNALDLTIVPPEAEA